MLKILRRRNNFLSQTLANAFIKRFFLSNAYKCTETWENRLKNPVFQKIDFDSLYHGLERNFLANKRINVLDIDLLTCCLTSSEYRTELEDVLLKLRLSPESILLPERTSHAIVRWYMDHAPKEDLLNLLSDRINYGIFPDYYLNNLLMNKFLVNKDPVSAVKIAVLQMLQEDLEHPIMKILSLYSCYSYLASSEVWKSVKEPEPDPDEEVQKVRVNFIRNPYYDDHFDIKDTNHLVGKTLLLFGQSLDNSIGISSQLIGLVLYEKYEKAVSFLENTIQNNNKIYEEAVAKAKEFTLNRPKQTVEEKTSEEKDADISKEEDNKKSDPLKQNFLNLLEKLDSKNLIKGNLLSDVEEIAKKTIEENENKDIHLQCEIYKQWEKEREDHIHAEILFKRQEQAKIAIQTTRDELEKEEQRLFFFENEDKLQLVLEKQEEKMKSVVHYKSKRKGKNSEDKYIPPVV